MSHQEVRAAVLNCGVTGGHSMVTQRGTLGFGIRSGFKCSFCSFIKYLMSAYYGLYTGVETVLVSH